MEVRKPQDTETKMGGGSHQQVPLASTTNLTTVRPPTAKWAEDVTRHKMANQHIKIVQHPKVILEMQINMGNLSCWQGLWGLHEVGDGGWTSEVSAVWPASPSLQSSPWQ